LAGRIAADGWIVAVGRTLGGEESHGGHANRSKEHEPEEHKSGGASDQTHASAATNQRFESAEDAWEEIHEFLANFTVLLVVLHIAGVFLSGIAHRENLIRAMFTGLKQER
jgi:cytochrome b